MLSPKLGASPRVSHHGTHQGLVTMMLVLPEPVLSPSISLDRLKSLIWGQETVQQCVRLGVHAGHWELGVNDSQHLLIKHSELLLRIRTRLPLPPFRTNPACRPTLTVQLLVTSRLADLRSRCTTGGCTARAVWG